MNSVEKNPRYSIVVPAYNEAEWLPACLEGLHRAMEAVDLPGELLVVDNNSTDSTADIARGADARVVFEPVNQISRARNAGGRAARGDLLVFVDADTVLPPSVLEEALQNLGQGDCCGGGAAVSFDRPITGPAKWLVALWHWLARRYGLAAGCFVFCLREGFEAVGGFNERVYASEEVWFSRRLGKWGQQRGKRFHLITTAPVVTSARKLDHPWSTYLALFVTLLFPPAVYSRWLCWVWYTRKPRVSGANRGDLGC
jgi:glycosyltransferase involved in cell wall biosynthesis